VGSEESAGSLPAPRALHLSHLTVGDISVLHAVIGMAGKALSLPVMNSQADPELARSAVESVSQWRYRPTLLNLEPIEVATTIMVNFSLLL
jgi:hypothetical protein